MHDTVRTICCWTHCKNEQGTGTWTEINGEALPVCEEHWYGNIDAERRRLRAEVEQLRHERGLLAEAIVKAGVAAGIISDALDALTGPQLLLVAEDVHDALIDWRPLDIDRVR